MPKHRMARDKTHTPCKDVPALYKYRGFTVAENHCFDGNIFYVETPEGPIDHDTLKQARQTIDNIIEENALLAETERALVEGIRELTGQ